MAAAARAAAAAAAAAAAEARLLGRTVHREGRELPGDVRRRAVGARDLLRSADKLLEVRLALHADVLVDRHEPKSTRYGVLPTAAEVADALPNALVAVTVTRIALPTYQAVAVKRLLTAPAIVVQCTPSAETCQAKV